MRLGIAGLVVSLVCLFGLLFSKEAKNENLRDYGSTGLVGISALGFMVFVFQTLEAASKLHH